MDYEFKLVPNIESQDITKNVHVLKQNENFFENFFLDIKV